MTKSHKELIKFANEEIIGKGNLHIIDEVFATDYVTHAGGKDYTGHEFVRRFVGKLGSAISEIQVLEVEFRAQTGDTLVWQRTLGGVHTAGMMGIAPTGQKVVWRDMVVSRFDGGKIAEEWVVSELAGELLSKSLCT